METRAWPLALISAVASMSASAGLAMAADPPAQTGGECRDGSARQVLNQAEDDLDESMRQAYIAQQKQRVETERRLNKLRATHFGSIRNEQTRQAGILKLMEETDPANFPSLVKVFRREQPDVLKALCEHLRTQATEDADATLTWIAVFEERPEFRKVAGDSLARRIKSDGGHAGDVGMSVSGKVSSVIASAFKPGTASEAQQNAAAELAADLKLVQAIPALIQAQVQTTTAAISPPRGDTGTALGYIIVGQQQSFVSDLTPIVADSAVGFDPQLSVVTDGTVLRVIDAAVITYRTEINRALIRLSSDAWGRSTSHLGWDQRRWAEWYLKDFVPAQQTASSGSASGPG